MLLMTRFAGADPDVCITFHNTESYGSADNISPTSVFFSGFHSDCDNDIEVGLDAMRTGDGCGLTVRLACFKHSHIG